MKKDKVRFFIGLRLAQIFLIYLRPLFPIVDFHLPRYGKTINQLTEYQN